MNLKLAMYLRKSSEAEDRQVQSIDDQRHELEKLKEYKDNGIICTFDESKSAKQPGRLEFNKMISLIEAGNIDAIICWKLNRLARNPIDGGRIQWLLQQGVLKAIITPTKVYLPTDNVLMMAVELGVANQFIIDLSKDVRRGMQSKIEKGWMPGLAPLGYLNDKYADKGAKQILVDSEKFSLVRKMWEYLLSGKYSVPQITGIANDQLGLRNRIGQKLTLGAVYKTFKNLFYTGQFYWKGNIQQGKHQPMITLEEFDLAQKILGRKGVPRPKTKRLPFNGLIHCGECESMITCEEKYKLNKTTGNKRKYIYHHCTKKKVGVPCSQGSIRYEVMIEEIKNILNSITIPEDFLKWAITVLKEQNDIEDYNIKKATENHSRNLNQLTASISNLLNLYISPANADRSLLSDEEYKSQKNSLMQEKGRIEQEMKQISNSVDNWMELTEKTFNFATYARVWFEQGDFETKTDILRSLGQNLVLKDGKLHIELNKPYQIILEHAEQLQSQNIRLEPVVNSSNKTLKASFEDKISTWSGRRESNPCPQLGRLLYYHCTTPAFDQFAESAKIIANTALSSSL